MNTPTPLFGDISTGNDLAPLVDQNGELFMANQNSSHWYSLTIAVAPDAEGVANPQSMLALLRNGDDNWNAAGEIISYTAIGSTGINQRLVDRVFLESSRAQLNLGLSDEITNLDYGVGVISADPRWIEGESTFPIRDVLYFTLRKSWCDQNPTAWVASAPPSPSTVYVMTWSLAGGWAAPQVAFTHEELFPGVTGDVEIDALSVDQGNGTPTYPRLVVFSLTADSDSAATDPNVGWDQILVYQHLLTPPYGTYTPTTPLMTDHHYGTSKSMSTEFGLVQRSPGHRPADVKSTCGIDPRDLTIVSAMLGRANDALPLGDGDMGLSAFRTCSHTSAADTVTFQATGLDFKTYAAGYVDFSIEGPNGPVWTSDPFWIDTATRNRNSMDFPIPMGHPGTSPTPLQVSATLHGYDSTQHWVKVRQSWVITIGI